MRERNVYIWILPFWLALSSGFMATIFISHSMGVKNSPYIPYGIFFVVVAIAFVIVAIAVAPKDSNR
jgi:hypothetical protein